MSGEKTVILREKFLDSSVGMVGPREIHDQMADQYNQVREDFTVLNLKKGLRFLVSLSNSLRANRLILFGKKFHLKP